MGWTSRSVWLNGMVLAPRGWTGLTPTSIKARVQPNAEPPVDPQAARKTAVEILSQPKYQPKASSWLARALDSVAEWLDRLLPDVFEARASCADAAVNLLGIPYAFWALFVFLLCAIALVRVLRARV